MVDVYRAMHEHTRDRISPNGKIYGQYERNNFDSDDRDRAYLIDHSPVSVAPRLDTYSLDFLA